MIRISPSECGAVEVAFSVLDQARVGVGPVRAVRLSAKAIENAVVGASRKSRPASVPYTALQPGRSAQLAGADIPGGRMGTEAEQQQQRKRAKFTMAGAGFRELPPSGNAIHPHRPNHS